MDTYSVGPDGNGGFEVTVTHPSGDRGNTVPGFATEAAAYAWVSDRQAFERSVVQMPPQDATN
jgi:hypothetical protein